MLNGLLIDYNYCTGCHSCETACKVEHGFKAGEWGIRLTQQGPEEIAEGQWPDNYSPTPTDRCDLCADRVDEGRLPTCVHHCQARVMAFDTYDELAKLLPSSPRSVIYAVK